MYWQIGNSKKINCVIFNTIQGVFALSSYLDGLQPVFIYPQINATTGVVIELAHHDYSNLLFN